MWATTGVGVLHWDGTQWAFADLPKLDNEVIESFAAASPDSIWAVGGTVGPGGYVVPLILHWDGTRWSRSDVPPQVAGPLYAVAVAGNDVWADGGAIAQYSSAPIMLHLTAGHWHFVPVATLAFSMLTGLAMTGPSAGWASGPALGPLSGGVLLRLNGKKWESDSAALSGDKYLEALAAGPGGQVWGAGDVGVTGPPFSMRWTGSAWQAAPVLWPAQGPNVDLASVTAIPGGTAWAVGYSGLPEPGEAGGYSGVPEPGEEAVIFHWSGTGWTVAWQLAEPAGYLNGIGVVSASDAWSVAYVCTAIDNDNGCARTRFLALHWDGRTWNESWLPATVQPPRSTRSAASWASYWK